MGHAARVAGWGPFVQLVYCQWWLIVLVLDILYCACSYRN